MKKIINSLVFLFISVLSFGQISVTNTQTPEDLVNNILAGAGVVISNVTFNTSTPLAQANQVQASYFNANGTNFPLAEGVILASGNASVAVGPNNSGNTTNNIGVAADPNDVDLDQLNQYTMNNEAILEFDFIPNGDTIVFNYIFASEEYHNYAVGTFNDAFGFFISGPGFAGPFSNGGVNIATIPGTGGLPVTMNNVNNGTTNTGPCTNCAFMVDNTNGTEIQYDARTIVMQAAASVQCGVTYHIKLAIGDAHDTALDSGVFLEANSFSSNGANISIVPTDSNGDPLVNNELYEGCTSAQIIMVNPPGYTDSTFVVNITTSGTATNGTDYSMLNPQYIIPPGQDTLIVDIISFSDAIAEGIETIIIETYYVNACGDTIWINETINILDVAPSFNTITTDSTFTCPSDNNLTLTAMTDGGVPNLTYDWGALGSTQSIIVPMNLAGTIAYPVTITDACGIVSTGTFNVTLNAAPIPTLGFNVDGNTNNVGVTLCPSENADLEVASINGSFDPGNETYAWYTINNPTTTSDTIPTATPIINPINVSPNVETWYYVDVFDGCYKVTDSLKISMGTVNVTAINTVQAESCPGQAGVLGEIEILPLTAGWQYSITGAGTTVGPQAGNEFLNLNGNIDYIVTVTNPDGCEYQSTVFVSSTVAEVLADWILTSLDTTVTCFETEDATAEVNNISGGIANGPYSIYWQNEFGHIDSLINVPAGNTGSYIDSLFGNPNAADGLMGWSVTIIEQGEGCAWNHNFQVYEPHPLTFLNVTNDPNCFEDVNGSFQLMPVGGNTPYTTLTALDPNGTQIAGVSPSSTFVNNIGAGDYVIEVTDPEGCTASETLTLNQPPELAIQFTLTNPDCYGYEVGSILIDTVLNYQGTPYDSLEYTWTPDPHNISGYGIDLANYLRFVPEGTYTLALEDENCLNIFTFDIEYPEQLVSTLSVTHPALCRDSQYTFNNGGGQISATVSGGSNGQGQGTNYTTNGGSITWFNNTTGNTNNSSTWGDLNPGYYTFRVVNDLGCVLSDTIYLDSISPVADFELTSLDFTSAYEGTAIVNVTLTNQSLNYAFENNPTYGPEQGLDTLFHWTMGFPNGDFDTIAHDINGILSVPYTSAGVYEVCLVVEENLYHCKDTACQTILIHDVPTLVTPNVFTPGNDGVNDNFYFPNQAIIEFECTVVNSWGNIVYVFTDINDQWDGTNQSSGVPCVDGVYFYTYSGESSNGTQYVGQGDLQLINGN